MKVDHLHIVTSFLLSSFSLSGYDTCSCSRENEKEKDKDKDKS